MPTRIRDPRRFHGRANIDISSMLGAMGGGAAGAAINPSFNVGATVPDPSAGEAMGHKGYNEALQTHAKTQSPFVDKRNWMQRVSGEPNEASALNNQYLMTKLEGDMRTQQAIRLAELQHKYGMTATQAAAQIAKEQAILTNNMGVMAGAGMPYTPENATAFNLAVKDQAPKTAINELQARADKAALEAGTAGETEAFRRMTMQDRSNIVGANARTGRKKAELDEGAVEGRFGEQRQIEGLEVKKAGYLPFAAGLRNLNTGEDTFVPTIPSTVDVNQARINDLKSSAAARDFDAQLLQGALQSLVGGNSGIPPITNTNAPRMTAPVPALPKPQTPGVTAPDATVELYLRQAGGDINKARTLLQQAGWAIGQ